jgi:uncharacterized membrane protein YhdT
MPRVWKHFLKNLAWPVGIAAYIFSVVTGGVYLETQFEGGAMLTVLIFIALPILVYLVRDMWRDAKEKVKWENEDLLRNIKGD